ncbi:MAG TPA: hypothetical protein VHE55_19950 [Fimbriimonadaceae bacterium]|nr:hypothetical protein [Fimbriimonadaceae bacterium]
MPAEVERKDPRKYGRVLRAVRSALDGTATVGGAVMAASVATGSDVAMLALAPAITLWFLATSATEKFRGYEDTDRLKDFVDREARIWASFEEGVREAALASGIGMEDLPLLQKDNFVVFLQRLIERHAKTVEPTLHDLREELEKIQEQGPLGRKVLEALDWQEDRLGEIQKSVRDVRRRLHREPGLDRPSEFRRTGKDERKYAFREKSVAFVGRRKDIERLTGFLNDEDPYRWWVVTGPAGSGKSRMCWELCAEAENAGWTAGFLLDHDFDWKDWIPENDTLIVIDYVVESLPNVKELLEALAVKRIPAERRVRVLLLERDAEHLWLQELRDETRQRGRRSVDLLYDEPLEIPPLGANDARGIISQVLAAAGKPVGAEVPAQLSARFLSEVDPLGRPLFAAMFAEAYAELGQGVDWTVVDLTKNILNRELGRFRTCGVTEADLNLLVFASITGRIDPIEAQTLRFDGLAPTDLAIDWQPQALEALSLFGDPWDEARPNLTAMRPDVLGEHFVLERLSGGLRLDERSTMPQAVAQSTSRLLRAAWKRHAGASLAFQLRALEDHPIEARKLGLDMPPAGVKASAFAYAALIFQAPDWDSRRRIYTRMRTDHVRPSVFVFNGLLAKAPPDEVSPLLDEMRKLGVPANVVTYNTRIVKTDLVEGRKLLEEMRKLRIWPDEVTYNTLIAKADLIEGRKLFNEMCELDIPPNMVTYNSLGKLLTTFEQAVEAVRTDLEAGKRPIYQYLMRVGELAPSFEDGAKLVREVLDRYAFERDDFVLPLVKCAPDFGEGLNVLRAVWDKGAVVSPGALEILWSRAEDVADLGQVLDLMNSMGYMPRQHVMSSGIGKASNLREALDLERRFLPYGYRRDVDAVVQLVGLASVDEAPLVDEIIKSCPPAASRAPVVSWRITLSSSYAEQVSIVTEACRTTSSLNQVYVLLARRIRAFPEVFDLLRLMQAAPLKNTLPIVLHMAPWLVDPSDREILEQARTGLDQTGLSWLYDALAVAGREGLASEIIRQEHT